MPESEPKPKLIELVAPGAGQGWKATLRNGKAAVIHEIAAPAAEAAAAVPRIQRLADHRHPALAPVLAWGTDPNGIWVAVEPNEGVPLGTILSRGPLTPAAAAALGAAVLSGVAALHEAGIAMGGFGASAVRVTGNGEVRLSGHPAAAVRGAPSQSDLRADVRSCGMAICAAFGVDPAGAPAPPSIPPGLVVTMRSMASGAMGPAADRAQGALREMASALLAPDRMTAAQSELALRAGGREMPSITPFLPKETFPPGAAQPPPLTPWGRPAPEEPPVRKSVSYEAPPRPMETYPPPPPPPVPPPYVPPQRPEEDRPGSYEPRPRAPEAFPTVPPPAEAPAAPAPVPTWDAKPAAPAQPSAPTWDAKPAAPVQPSTSTWDAAPSAPAAPPAEPEPPAPSSPAAPGASIWEVNPPAPPQAASQPPAAPAPPAPPAPVPAAPASPPPPEPEARPTWTAIPTPRGRAEPEEIPETAEPEPAAPAYVAPVPSATTTKPPASAAATTSTVAPAAPARKPPAPRRPVRDVQFERPSWLVPAIAAVVVLLLIVVGTGIFLANRGNGGHVAGGPSPKASPKASPKVTPSPTGVAGPLPVPAYAPAAADPVTKVQFCSAATPCTIPGSPSETATACTLSGSCHIEVGMYFSTGQRGPVAFALKFFDRCANTTTDLPGPNPYSPPGYTIVILEKNVSLPSGAKSAGLVAVTSTPASAASAPLLLGSDSCA